jgi:hypothetical protein
LQTWLQNRYPHIKVVRHESIYYDDGGISRYWKETPYWQPWIILRDNVDRIWSAYHFFGDLRNEITLEEYLDGDYYAQMSGERNPIKQADYARWLTPWIDLDYEVV